MIYKTLFNLTAAVNDYEKARDYLLRDDMMTYLRDDINDTLSEKLVSIVWNLKDIVSGEIILTTNVELSEDELKTISNWVHSQNMDGIGEGFSGQRFANYEDTGLEGFEGSDWDNEMVMATFDYKTNQYLFEKIAE